MKTYKLMDAGGNIYESETPGEYGGNGKMKIYGKLDCPSANSTIKRFPGKYEEHRVFFCRRENSPCGRLPSVWELPTR